MRICSSFLMATLALAPTSRASSQAAQRKIPIDLARAMSGAWACRGAFANGRPIGSTLTIEPALDSVWLVATQTDRPPNRYAFRSSWNVLPSGDLQSIVVDNFGGVRRFVAAAWRGDTLAFVSDSTVSTARRERFTYVRDGAALRMAYEVSRQGGPWMVGDSLRCARG